MIKRGQRNNKYVEGVKKVMKIQKKIFRHFVFLVTGHWYLVTLSEPCPLKK